MIGGLFRFITRLLLFVVLVVLLTTIYVIYDGVTDTPGEADCAVVLGAAVRSDGEPGPAFRERLDTAIKLYNSNKIPVIIVSGADPVKGEGHSEAAGAAKYLREHEIPAKSIIEDHDGVNTDATAHDLVGIMKNRDFKSVRIVTTYYHMTRTKMALKHEGIDNFTQTHAGTVRKEDFFNTAREVVDIYYHLYKYYLGPAASKATVQLQSEAQKLNSQLRSKTKELSNEAGKSTR